MSNHRTENGGAPSDAPTSSIRARRAGWSASAVSTVNRSPVRHASPSPSESTTSRVQGWQHAKPQTRQQLVDLQVNGFAGVDFLHADAEDYIRAGAALARTGVLAYQPALITSAPDQTVAALAAADRAQAKAGGARILGVHLEGPFLSPERPGTHPAGHRRTRRQRLPRRALLVG